jgi:hypothetical protein
VFAVIQIAIDMEYCKHFFMDTFKSALVARVLHAIPTEIPTRYSGVFSAL